MSCLSGWWLVIWEVEEEKRKEDKAWDLEVSMLLTTDRPGFLLSPHWPMWSEALGFMRWSKEDSQDRNGWLHSAGADI